LKSLPEGTAFRQESTEGDIDMSESSVDEKGTLSYFSGDDGKEKKGKFIKPVYGFERETNSKQGGNPIWVEGEIAGRLKRRRGVSMGGEWGLIGPGSLG